MEFYVQNLTLKTSVVRRCFRYENDVTLPKTISRLGSAFFHTLRRWLAVKNLLDMFIRRSCSVQPSLECVGSLCSVGCRTEIKFNRLLATLKFVDAAAQAN